MFPNRQKLNIDGDWLFIPDPDKKGEEQQWFSTPPFEKGAKILLPLTKPIQDINDTSDLWFLKEFDIQSVKKDILLFLHLQNINYKSVLWLNGHYIGTHEGSFTKFNFNITKYTHTGKNLLVIKVSPFPIGSSPISSIVYDTSWIRFPGIWGNIYIEFTPLYHIQNIQVRPDIRGKRVITNVYVNHRDCILRTKIPELDVCIESKQPKLVMQLENFKTWGPNSPQLYTMQVEYITDASSDFAEIKFGMRDFSINENQFTLNFKPFYVRAFHFDWNIENLNTPLYSDDNLKDCFLKICKANFNLLLSYGQPLPDKIIRICDEIGIMIAETPSLQCDTNFKRWRELSQIEIEEMLDQRLNNPSFVWLLLEYTSENFNTSSFVHRLRKIDRSRLIMLSPPSPLFKNPSQYCIPYNIEMSSIKQIWTKLQEYPHENMQNFFEHIGNENTPNFIIQSQLNRTDFKIINEKDTYEHYKAIIKKGFEERDLSLSLNSVENFLEQIQEIYMSNLQFCVTSLLQNSKIKGYCFHNIYKRNPFHLNESSNFLKISDELVAQLQKINDNCKLVISCDKTNILQDEETTVNIFFIPHNREIFRIEKGSNAILSLHISSPSQQVLWKKKKELKLKKDNSTLWTGEISGSGKVGQHILIARLSLNNQTISETYQSFYVLPTPQPTNVPVEFIDIQKKFSKLCAPWVGKSISFSPIYIIPPIYNSVFSYPENEFVSMMEQVRHGAVGIIFSPPDDWNELIKIFPNCPQFHSINLNYPNEFLHFHYVKPHPLFLNLPNRCVIKQEYKNIIPTKIFLEKGDEDICGCLLFPKENDKEPFWGSDILVNRYGVGKLVFVNLRILENIPEDPVATHLLINMVNYFSRRAIPADKNIPLLQNTLEHLRAQRNNRLRKWMVIGEFAIIEDKSEEKSSYPNVNSIDINSKYWGKYGEVEWKPYYTDREEKHLLDFHEALSLSLDPYYLFQDSGVAFAFAEFNYENKEEVIVQLETSNMFQLWLNNNKVLENLNYLSKVQIFESKVTLNKWKNSIFIKVIKEKGEHSFSINFYNNRRKPININW